MGAVLQLERFDRGGLAAPPPPTFTAEDVADAHARGVAEGRLAAKAAQTDSICAALAELSKQLDQEVRCRAEAAPGQAQALGSLVAALLDGVMPAVARARLEAALMSELLHLSESISPLRARLRCGPDLAPFVAACLARTENTAIEIAPTGPDGTVEAELLGGVITWDVAVVAAQLRALVEEILEGN